MTITISTLIQQSASQLPQSLTPILDIELLLQHVLAKPRSYLYAHPQQALTPLQLQQFHELFLRRQQNEPIAYILGTQEFWSMPLIVTRDTLIPRPETELLVELCLQKLPATPLTILDLGTGSGAIALALAKERPMWNVTATDKSAAAIQVAKANAHQLTIENIEFIVSNWYQNIPQHKRFHAIVSNPPYIAPNDPHLIDLNYEPQQALVANQNGLADLYCIVQQSIDYVVPNGWLLVEHGYDQATAVQAQMQHYGYQQIESISDLTGHLRVTMGVLPSSTD